MAGIRGYGLTEPYHLLINVAGARRVLVRLHCQSSRHRLPINLLQPPSGLDSPARMSLLTHRSTNHLHKHYRSSDLADDLSSSNHHYFPSTGDLAKLYAYSSQKGHKQLFATKITR